MELDDFICEMQSDELIQDWWEDYYGTVQEEENNE